MLKNAGYIDHVAAKNFDFRDGDALVLGLNWRGRGHPEYSLVFAGFVSHVVISREKRHPARIFISLGIGDGRARSNGGEF